MRAIHGPDHPAPGEVFIWEAVCCKEVHEGAYNNM